MQMKKPVYQLLSVRKENPEKLTQQLSVLNMLYTRKGFVYERKRHYELLRSNLIQILRVNIFEAKNIWIPKFSGYNFST